MPRTKISEFSATPGNNTDIDGINLAEGCAPSGINDAIRELMSQLKDFQAGTAGDSFNGPIGATTPAAGTFTNLSASGTFALTGDQVQISEGGTGQTTANAAFNALAPSQTSNSGKYLKTDGTNTSWDALDISTADITGTLPIANGGTGLTALGTGVQTALGIAVGSSGAFVVNGGALGTPSSGTVTNLTGTASININGTVGATTPTTGAFTTLSASGNITVSGGTANGVAYLNGSKVLTTGSALTFDGTNFSISTGSVNISGGRGSNRALTFPDWLIYNSATGNGLVFDNGSEQMRLTSTGLGIGTSSPVSALNVAGTTAITWFAGGTSSGLVTIGTQGTGGSLFVNTASLNGIFASGLGVDGSYSGGASTVNIKAYGVNSGGPYGSNLAFFTSSTTSLTEKMRLDSSGNLGIGVTPSAWGAGSQALQNGGGSFFQYNNDRIFIGQNNYIDSAFADRYITSNFATRYRQFQGTHAWYTAPSGTAGNAISFTQAMTLTAAGKLGIGTTNPPYLLSVADNGGAGFEVGPGSTYLAGRVLLQSYNRSTSAYTGFDYSALDHTFSTSGTERARITSGGMLLVGTTTAYGSGGLTIEPAGTSGVNLVWNKTVSGNVYATQFRYNGTIVGSIEINNTATSYVTSSDYRLKEHIAPMTGALAKVALLKPCTYKWKVDGSDGEGFIAHELAEVCPQAVTGEKDAVDKDGNPKYQGIDTSFLVATLTAAIQEQQAIITDLRARVAQLEAK